MTRRQLLKLGAATAVAPSLSLPAAGAHAWIVETGSIRERCAWRIVEAFPSFTVCEIAGPLTLRIERSNHGT
jgi:hypothetical protein